MPGSAEDMFRERMKRTEVRREDEGLQLVHHATRAAFDPANLAPFTHFGTRGAARARVPESEAGEVRLNSAFLDIRNPLYVDDVNDDHSPEHVAELIEAVHPGLVGNLEDLFDLEPGYQEEYLVAVLREAGFDGLGYRNLHEDPGSMSWIVLDAAQVIVQRDGPANGSREPWELSAEEYTGPSMVAEVFAIDGNEEEYEHLLEALREEGPDLPVLRTADGWEARWLDDWEPEATMGLLDPQGRPRGFYMRGQLWVDEDARGAGRSALMVNAAADLLGGCPAQNPNGMGFSPAGHAAHLAAHRAVRAWAEVNGYALEAEATALDPEV